MANTPGWDRDLTGALIRVYPDESFDGPMTVTGGGHELISVTAIVDSVGVDEATLRPVLNIVLNDDNGTRARFSPHCVELLAAPGEPGY